MSVTHTYRLRNLVVPTINWGGIFYTRSRGRIVRIFRPPPPSSDLHSDTLNDTQGLVPSDGAAAAAAPPPPPLAPPVALTGEAASASALSTPQLSCRSTASQLLSQQPELPDLPPLRSGNLHPPMRSSWFLRSWEISALDEQSDLMNERNESPVSMESQSPRRNEHTSTASLRHIALNPGVVVGGGGGARGRAATSSSADAARQTSAHCMNPTPPLQAVAPLGAGHSSVDRLLTLGLEPE